jgi:hypothetical protein
VELLRNAEPLDRAIADQFGRFVMTPSRLPSGDYELTLRSRQGNGKQATSHRSVAVTVQPSLTDQNIAPMTSGKASVVPAKPLVSSNVHHPSRTRREATGPAAQDLSGRPKLFNHVMVRTNNAGDAPHPITLVVLEVQWQYTSAVDPCAPEG